MPHACDESGDLSLHGSYSKIDLGPPRYGSTDFGFRTVTSLLPAANFRLGLHACGQTAVNVRDVAEFECSCTTQATHSCGGNIMVELPPLPWKVCPGKSVLGRCPQISNIGPHFW